MEHSAAERARRLLRAACIVAPVLLSATAGREVSAAPRNAAGGAPSPQGAGVFADAAPGAADASTAGVSISDAPAVDVHAASVGPAGNPSPVPVPIPPAAGLLAAALAALAALAAGAGEVGGPRSRAVRRLRRSAAP